MSYYLEISHEGLNRYRRVRGSDPHDVEQKAQAQMAVWEEMWQRKQEAELAREKRRDAQVEKDQKKALAATETEEAEKALDDIDDTLVAALDLDPRIDWDRLKDFSQFTKPRPQQPTPSVAAGRPERPKPFEVPKEPRIDDPKYLERALQVRRRSLRELFSPASKVRNSRINLITALHAADHEEWSKKVVPDILERNAERERQHAERVIKWELESEALRRRAQEQYAQDLRKWESEKEAFLLGQLRKNDTVDRQEQEYLDGRQDAVGDYCSLVLTNSHYPDSFPRDFDLEYNATTRTLIMDYCLPSPDDLPTVKDVKYVQSSDELRESHLSESALNKMYDDLLYKMALRSMHELYEADVIQAIDSIVFNGWVNSVDKSTGKEVRPCVLSVQAGREEFLAINLAQVDPKACFRKLKGVAASKLHALAAVPPVAAIDREDARFISPREVVASLGDSENLAAMDWQDFEHLIRELFEKEFAGGGGEVNVTRASRDYGVDAIAFDPDPIRGGKIVIQAKRYTNTVGVAAVRDLYGTVINEGATKGILITTADYGPDAYEFAKGKPLTLLNGGHLLHLLDKHGHRARIDLQEAKRILAEREG